MMMPKSLAVRCDGNDRIGAGHVGRCLPLARAFVELGWRVWFTGRFEGVACRLLADFPVGELRGADAVIVDSYERQDLPDLPTATLGESLRYPGAIAVDYHADRLGQPSTASELVGPAYAPVDPRFAGVGRAADPIANVLVAVGASAGARRALPELLDAARRIGPSVIVADGSFSLLERVGEVDAAISGAGMTAYELASAGVPLAVVELAINQRRVVDGLTRAGIAVTEPDLLRPGPNERGMRLFDGGGAMRAAAALQERWSLV